MFKLKQVDQCDTKIKKVINRMGNLGENQEIKKRKPIRHHSPSVDKLGANLMNIFTNNDATRISVITDYSCLQLLSETGRDLSRWPSEKHFTSWLGLSPSQHNSGKMRRNAKKKGKPKGGQIFRMIAQGLINSKNIAVGAFGRKLRVRKGPRVAIKAMARKLAVLYWRVMVKGVEYAEKGIQHYEEQLIINKLRTVHRLAKDLKMNIIECQ